MNLRINTAVPTVVEIKKALKELRNGKAAGVDNISPEGRKEGCLGHYSKYAAPLI